jgi:hypothetical protein
MRINPKTGAIGGGLVLALLLAGVATAATINNLLPSSDGAYTQWTPSTGSTHYTLVDESSCNGTTDYVRTTTIGKRDSYGVSLAAVPDGSTITSIAIKPCASKNSNGGSNSTMNVFYRWNGANSADAGSYSLSGTTPVVLATTTYSGLALTKSTSSALQVGAVLAAGNKGARLSQMRVAVTYTPPPTPPSAPTNLSATTYFNATSSSWTTTLVWTDTSSNENGFTVERSDNTPSSFITIATTSANRYWYYDTAVQSGNTYYYRVNAYNDQGASGYSNTASTTIP